MDTTLIFRPATRDEQPRIMELIGRAQAQMRAAGSDQWQDGYPAAEHIMGDIDRGYGYALCQAERPGKETLIAYGAVVFDGESAYDAIEGIWETDAPYVVIHRLVVDTRLQGQGLAGAFMRHTEQLALARGITAFRIDTNHDNHRMLHAIARAGFAYRGKVRYRGGERLAFEKALATPHPQE